MNENATTTIYDTEYFKNKYNITVKGFDIDYVTFQGEKTRTCPTHATATILNIYYSANIFEYNSFWGGKDDYSGSVAFAGSNDTPNSQGRIYSENLYKEKNDYLDELKKYLDAGIPVEIVVYDTNTNNTHFVGVIGYDEVDENGRIVFEKLVITDSGTSQEDKKVCHLGDSHDNSNYTIYNWDENRPNQYRIITPYLIDENREFILDENGNKTTDVSYAQVSNSEDDNEISPSVFDIIDNTDMPEHEKNRIKGIIQRDIDNKVNYAIEKAKMMMSLSILKAVHKKSNTASTTVYDPIILDLDGDGFNVETKENGTNFDLDKNGFAEKINWTTKDGFLCLDLKYVNPHLA